MKQRNVGRKAKTVDSAEDGSGSAEADKNSCVYIYTRANFARPPGCAITRA